MEVFMAYISGGMTGYKDYNFPRFNQVEEMLQRRGFHTFNPADLGVIDDWDWDDYMRYDINIIVSYYRKYDNFVMVMLEGWENSKGACVEHSLASALGVPIVHVKEIDNLVKYKNVIEGKYKWKHTKLEKN